MKPGPLLTMEPETLVAWSSFGAAVPAWLGRGVSIPARGLGSPGLPLPRCQSVVCTAVLTWPVALHSPPRAATGMGSRCPCGLPSPWLLPLQRPSWERQGRGTASPHVSGHASLEMVRASHVGSRPPAPAHARPLLPWESGAWGTWACWLLALSSPGLPAADAPPSTASLPLSGLPAPCPCGLGFLGLSHLLSAEVTAQA